MSPRIRRRLIAAAALLLAAAAIVVLVVPLIRSGQAEAACARLLPNDVGTYSVEWVVVPPHWSCRYDTGGGPTTADLGWWPPG